MEEKLLSLMGLDIGLFVGIVIATELFKKADKTNKFQKFYGLVPVILSLGIGFLTVTPFKLIPYLHSVFVYALASVGMFTYGKQLSMYRKIFSLDAPETPTTPVASPSAPVVVPPEAMGASKEGGV